MIRYLKFHISAHNLHIFLQYFFKEKKSEQWNVILLTGLRAVYHCRLEFSGHRIGLFWISTPQVDETVI